MAKQTLNAPVSSHQPLNTGDSPELGDSATTLINKLNAMLTELYNKAVTAFSKYTTNATVGATTAAAGDLTGAQTVACNYSAVGAANLTTRTAAQMFADHDAVVGQTYNLEIMNSAAGTTTLVGGTGVTINGTATMATNTVRWFMVTFVSATAVTIQNEGSGAI